MKATITSTDQLLELDGVPVRVWRGETELGVPFIALIHRVAVDAELTAQFDRELTAVDGPRAATLSRLELARLTGSGWNFLSRRMFGIVAVAIALGSSSCGQLPTWPGKPKAKVCGDSTVITVRLDSLPDSITVKRCPP